MEGLVFSRASLGGGGSTSNPGGGAGGILGMNSISIGSRSSSASSAERSLLLGALATHMGVLDARENDAQTIIRKSELWDEITRQFNAHTLAPRSRQQIQTLYKNMKAKARRYEARLAEVASGVPPPDPDPISEMLLGLLHQQMQHQRRHLQRLAVLDNYSHTHTLATQSPPTDDTVKPFNTNVDTPILTPEQVMQVSLEEGLATEMDMKDEPQDTTVTASPEDPLQKRDEEEEEEGKQTEEHKSSSSVFPESVFTPLRTGISAISPLAATGTVAATLQNHQQEEQQQQQQGGTTHQTPLSSPAQCFTSSSLRLTNTTIPCNANLQSPSKTPLSLQFSTSYLPHTSAHTLSYSRSSLGTSTAADHLSQSTKRPKLDIVGDAGRLRGCGGGLSSHILNSHCCCPDLHATLATQAEQEHQLRMKALMEESEARGKEHAVRMRILSLEEEMLRARLVVGRECESEKEACVPEPEADGADDGGDEYNV